MYRVVGEDSMRKESQLEIPRDVTFEEIDFGDYVKRPQSLKAVQVLEPFVVKTPQGDTKKGNPKDYIVETETGSRYPVDKRVFESTHRSLDPEDPEEPHERREWYGIDWAGETAGQIAQEALIALSDSHEELRRDGVEAHIERLHIEIATDTKESGAQLIVSEPGHGGDNMD